MKNITLVLLILFYFNTFAQDTTITTGYKKVLIGINFSPDYCYRTLFNNNSSNISNIIIESRNNRETAKIGYTIGSNFIYNFNKRIGIGLGVLFSNNGYQTTTSGFTFGDMVNAQQGFTLSSTDPSIPRSLTSVDNLYYLDFPFKFTLTFGSKKLRFITSLGFSTNLLITASTTTTTEYNDGSIKKTTQASNDPYNRVNFSPTLSFGPEFKIKNRSFIRVEPSFKYGILNIIDSPITAKLWSAGLNISYYFGIKK